MDEWDDDSEEQLKQMGERAGGLRWMHDRQARKWTMWGNTLTGWSLSLTTFGAAASLSFAQYAPLQMWIMYSVGMTGMVSTIIQIARQYYTIDSQISMHKMVARRLGSFYRRIEHQLSTDRGRRQSMARVMDWAIEEFERIQSESPTLDCQTILSFRKRFEEIDGMSIPDVAAKDLSIVIKG